MCVERGPDVMTTRAWLLLLMVVVYALLTMMKSPTWMSTHVLLTNDWVAGSQSLVGLQLAALSALCRRMS